MKTLTLALFVCFAAAAQVYPPGGGNPGGQYPGGQYPGGQYPGQRLPTGGIPIPKKGGKQPDKNKIEQPMPNFRGVLRQMDDKSVSVELGDNRVLDFKRTGSTKFFKGGDEVKTPKFAAGDQVSVEALEEPGGYLTAVNIYWEKAGGAKPAKPADDTTVDTWKDVPRMSTDKPAEAAPPTPAPTPTASTPAASAPGRPDPDDPGPPKLRRGGAADPSRQVSAPVPAQEDKPVVRMAPPNEERVTVLRGDNDEDPAPVRTSIPKDEPLIRRAADTALDFTDTLPSYVCTEMVARYQSESRPANFQPIDVLSVEVVFENGREDYRNLQINGKPSKKKLEETGGAWSTGEFGTVLVDLFSPATAAQFHFKRDSRTAGLATKVYDFEVDREHSHWTIKTGSQNYVPAYSGSVWIDPLTARVMRIEMQAKGFPSDFPTDHVEAATDYSNVRLGDAKQYLLPVHSENIMCQRGTSICSRNVIDFRNYHKYSGESTITFGGTAKDK